MSVNINDPAYDVLNTYAILAYSGITAAGFLGVSNGFYGSSPIPSYTGVIMGTPGTTTNNGIAQTQLTDLVSAINAVATNFPLTSVATGEVTYVSGKYVSSSLVTYGPGTSIILDPGSNPNAQFFFIGAPGITFDSISSIAFKTGTGGSFSNVYWLTNNGIISFTGSSPPLIQGIFIGSSKVTFALPSTIIGRVYAQTENVTFGGSGQSFVDGSMPIVCYAKGSLILTEREYTPIENIKVGDKIVVKGKIHDVEYFYQEEEVLKSVVWVGSFEVNNMSNESCPICIKANAFEENVPFEDLYVSPSHRILFNDRMTEARDLINGETVFQDLTKESVEYYHIEVKDHSVIYANGILSESYFDAENRNVFNF